MGGYFGASLKHDAISDVFFGTDYHSHLGTKCGGMAAYSEDVGLQREIHSISNSLFRTKFDHVFNDMKGNSAIGCISDFDPQPLLVRSRLGKFAICFVGIINNAEQLIQDYFNDNSGHFNAMTGGNVNSTELVAALIGQRDNFVDGIHFAQEVIEGTASILILKDDGKIIAARDRLGRIPVQIGRKDEGYAVSFEAYAYQKLDYDHFKELGPGEIVEICSDYCRQLAEPGKEMRICSFLWSYYGYPTATYEGKNVELMQIGRAHV